LQPVFVNEANHTLSISLAPYFRLPSLICKIWATPNYKLYNYGKKADPLPRPALRNFSLIICVAGAFVRKKTFRRIPLCAVQTNEDLW